MNYALIFPGQGSQSLGMLSDLSDNFSIVRQTFAQASQVLGLDLWQLCQTNSEALNQTQNTQPAMLAAGFATYQVLASEMDLSPRYLAGHSLGEYTALVVGGYLTFSAAISLVKTRAELMQNAVKEGKGAMAAILGLEDHRVVALCASIADGVVEAVNFNSPGQVVIAGDKSAVLLACELMKDNGAKRAIVLPVSVPSHCSLMNEASIEFAKSVEQSNIVLGATPIVHNVSASVVDTVAQIKNSLVEQLKSSVQWTNSVKFMKDNHTDILIECGPGKVLAGLTKRIDKSIQGLAITNTDSLTNAVNTLNGE